MVVFAIGMCVAALMERRAEVASVFNNRRTPMSGIVARNDLFKDDSRGSTIPGSRLLILHSRASSTAARPKMCLPCAPRW